MIRRFFSPSSVRCYKIKGWGWRILATLVKYRHKVSFAREKKDNSYPTFAQFTNLMRKYLNVNEIATCLWYKRGCAFYTPPPTTTPGTLASKGADILFLALMRDALSTTSSRDGPGPVFSLTVLGQGVYKNSILVIVGGLGAGRGVERWRNKLDYVSASRIKCIYWPRKALREDPRRRN